MTLEKALRFVVLTGVFALPFIPLIVAQSLFFPFITGKNFAFRIIVEIIAGAWLALALVHPQYRPNRSWLLSAFALFILVIGLADVFGANAMKSIWSNFERMEGWVTLAHLFAYFVVAISVLKTENLWKRLWQTSIGVSVLIATYGIFQLMGFITINQGGVRIDATFGNATYLAVYMLFHIFLTALLWAQSWNDARSKMLLGVTYGTIIALQSFVLLFTATRGAILGLVGGVFLSALLMIVLANKSKVAWRLSVGVVVAILFIAGGFFALKDTVLVQGVEPLARVASISFSESTVNARFMNWCMALEGIKERPLLGWGQENYNLVFNKYYNPGMYAQEPWFDRVHNIIFDWLVAGGIIGFLAYASLFVFALLYIWRGRTFSPAEKAILTGLLAAYGFHNLFVFDNVVSYILFFSVFAYIAVRATNEGEHAVLFQQEWFSRKALPFVSVAVIVCVWGVAWGVNAKALAANRALLQAVAPQQGGIEKNLEYFKESMGYNTFGIQEAREQLAQGAARLAGNNNIPDEVRAQFFDTARKEMEMQIASAQDDARFPLFLGTLLNSYGLTDEGLQYLEKAHELSPNKQAILFQIGFAHMNRGDTTSALQSFKEAFELAPEYEQARSLYVAALITNNDFYTASEIQQPLIEIGATPDQRTVAAYVSKGRYDKVIELWKARAERYPEDVQARFALSAAYFASGNVAETIRQLEATARDIPASAAQAQQLIEQIRNGTAVLQ